MAENAALEKGLELVGMDIQENLVRELRNRMQQENLTEDDMAMPPLDKEEVDIALAKIEELHPLSRMPVLDVFPYLCCLCKKLRKGSREEETELIDGGRGRSDSMVLIEDEIKDTDKRLNDIIKTKAKAKAYAGTDYVEDELQLISEVKNQFKKPSNQAVDPFNGFGFGVVAYFKMLRFLLVTYAALTVIAGGIIVMYYNGHTIEGSDKKSMMAQFTLGNLGFTSSFCTLWYQSLDKEQKLECTRGRLSKIIQKGIVPDKVGLSFRTGGHVPLDYCGASSELRSEDDCSSYILADFETKYNSDCKGKQTCQFNAPHHVSRSGGDKPKCTSGSAHVYVQYQCVMDAEETRQVQLIALKVILKCVLMSVIYLLVLYYLRSVTHLDFKLWDVSTTTASDFTIKLRITPRMWQSFKEDQAKQLNPLPLDQQIKQAVERKVQELPPVLRGHEKVTIEVAAVSIAYQNGQIIDLLRARGTHITNGNLKAIPEIDNKVNLLFLTQSEKLTTPVTAFITFTTQEGYERCSEFLSGRLHTGLPNPKKRSFEFLGEQAQIADAPEPTNVIWENLEVSRKEINRRKCLAGLAVSVFIFCTFLLFTYLKTKSGKNKLKYPSTVDCDSIYTMFDSKSEFHRYAAYDQDETSQMQGEGYYMCYCKKYGASDRKEGNSSLCDMYTQDTQMGFFLANLVTFLVSCINIVIRKLNIALIQKIGFHTESEQTNMIMISIFVATFINTGIILLLTNANLAYSVLSFVPIYNQYADLDRNWYLDIAPSLTQTMIIMAMFPYAEFCMWWSIKQAMRIMDSGFGSDPYQTKTVTLQQYVNLYAGPIYMMHFKYSSILTQIFVSFMYGMCIPLLFPIAFVGIFNMYIVERLNMAYYYMKPPMYDAKLNDSVLQILRWAPLLMFVFGYWAMGNEQIFFNNAATRTSMNQVMDPKHALLDFAHGLNQNVLMLLVIAILVFGRFIVFVLKRSGVFSKTTKLDQDLDVNENLPAYWSCIPGEEQKVWYTKEVYLREVMDLKTIDEKQLEKLRTFKRGKKKFAGSVNYDILSNRFYADAFQYQSMDARNEPGDFESSDMVLKALYTGQSYQHIKPGAVKSKLQNGLAQGLQTADLKNKILIQTNSNVMKNFKKKGKAPALGMGQALKKKFPELK